MSNDSQNDSQELDYSAWWQRKLWRVHIAAYLLTERQPISLHDRVMPDAVAELDHSLHCAIALSEIKSYEMKGSKWSWVKPVDVVRWAEHQGYNVPAKLRQLCADFPAGGGARPVQRSVHQEEEILRAIRKLGHNPKALPKAPRGAHGIKFEVQKRLTFTKDVFRKAWQRLRDLGQIADAD